MTKKRWTDATTDAELLEEIRGIANNFLTLYTGDRAKLAAGFLSLLDAQEERRHSPEIFVAKTLLSYKKNLVTDALKHLPPIAVAEGKDREARLVAEALAEYVFMTK